MGEYKNRKTFIKTKIKKLWEGKSTKNEKWKLHIILKNSKITKDKWQENNYDIH